MGARDEGCQILHEARFVRILEQYAEWRAVGASVEGHLFDRAHLDIDLERLRASAHHVDRLWQTAIADQKPRAPAVHALLRSHAVQQRHRFRPGRRLVQQRRVGDLHPREVRDHRLKVEE